MWKTWLLCRFFFIVMGMMLETRVIFCLIKYSWSKYSEIYWKITWHVHLTIMRMFLFLQRRSGFLNIFCVVFWHTFQVTLCSHYFCDFLDPNGPYISTFQTILRNVCRRRLSVTRLQSTPAYVSAWNIFQ